MGTTIFSGRHDGDERRYGVPFRVPSSSFLRDAS